MKTNPKINAEREVEKERIQKVQLNHYRNEILPSLNTTFAHKKLT